MRPTKGVLPILGFVLVFTAVGVPAQAQAFEGTLTFTTNGEQGPGTITQWVKGTNIRYDFNGDAAAGDRQGTLIIDPSAKTRTMLMPQRKMYMTMPYDPAATKAPAEKSSATWTRTGKKESVAGVPCEIIHGTGTQDGKPLEADICVAKGLGFGGATGGGLIGETLSRYANLNLAPGEGIVKMTSIEKGKSVVDFELTKVDRRPLAAADFQPPPGFTKFERPGPATKP